MINGGEQVTIFALVEKIGKVQPMNPLNLILMSKLLPNYMETFNPESLDAKRRVYLKIGKMRLMHRLIQFTDEEAFWTKLFI